MIIRLLILVLFGTAFLHADDYDAFSAVPTLYKGRIKPALTSAKEWVEELPLPVADTMTPLELLLSVQLKGWQSLADFPLFKEEKTLWSPKQLASYQGKRETLLVASAFFKEKLQEDPFVIGFRKLTEQGVTEKQALDILEASFPLSKRLLTEPVGFLPSKVNVQIWYPLSSLSLLTRKMDAWHKARNFSLYSPASLEEITKASPEKAASLLFKEYAKLNKVPALWRIHLEAFYQTIPFTLLLIGIYAAASLLLLLSGKIWGIFVFGAAVLLHLSLLLCRVLILQRPPVSNMEETVLFIPFVAAASSCLLAYRMRSVHPLFMASVGSALLFTLLQVFSIDVPLAPLQPILASNFWLTIHVLMVVGSYAFFLLSSISAHISLSQKSNAFLDKFTLVTQMLGLSLLIPGTILGGVWAQESWGRFWDWDPKEAWAFISCCFSLLAIHLYTFNKISRHAFSFLAALSFQVITFTWYGVNFILGVGLHSYGFGFGGELYYYSFLVIDLLYLIGTYLYSMKYRVN
jgi:ABC-type transport system involved in cytochrome c biogenesis permease subunit